MVKESSIQIFPIDLFVKGAYYVVKILYKYNGLRRNNRYEANCIISLKKNIVFAKLVEASFSSNILVSFTEFQCQGTDTFRFLPVEIFEIHIKRNFLRK